jgi:ABC-type transporter Mla subunit MlaD
MTDNDKATDRAAKELMKALDLAGKELEKAAGRVERISRNVYDSMPKELKDASQDLRNLANDVAKDLASDVPKVQKGLEDLGRRLDKYASQLEKTVRRNL